MKLSSRIDSFALALFRSFYFKVFLLVILISLFFIDLHFLFQMLNKNSDFSNWIAVFLLTVSALIAIFVGTSIVTNMKKQIKTERQQGEKKDEVDDRGGSTASNITSNHGGV